MSDQCTGTVIQPDCAHAGSLSVRRVREGTALDITDEPYAVPERPYVALKMFAPMGYGDLDSSDDECSGAEEDGFPASRSPLQPGAIWDYRTYTGTPRGGAGIQKLVTYSGREVDDSLCVMCCLMFRPEDTTLSQWKLELELWSSVCIPCMSSVLCRALRQTVDERPDRHKRARYHSPGLLAPHKATDDNNKHPPQDWRKNLT